MQLEREFKEALLKIRNYVSIRHFGPYEDVNETWARLTQFAFEQGIGGPQVTAFGVCHDCQAFTPSSQIRYDACLGLYPETYLQLIQKLTSSDEYDFAGIRLETMAPQRTVMTIHKGSYRSIREAYTDALRSAATKKLNFDARRLPTIEIYRNNPLFTKPDSLVTEIHFLSGDNPLKAD